MNQDANYLELKQFTEQMQQILIQHLQFHEGTPLYSGHLKLHTSVVMFQSYQVTWTTHNVPCACLHIYIQTLLCIHHCRQGYINPRQKPASHRDMSLFIDIRTSFHNQAIRIIKVNEILLFVCLLGFYVTLPETQVQGVKSIQAVFEQCYWCAIFFTSSFSYSFSFLGKFS